MKKLPLIAAVATSIAFTIRLPAQSISAGSECPELRLIFARGSGEQAEDRNFQAFKSEILPYLENVGKSYEFIDLDYPAVSIGIDNLWTMLGAYVSGGQAYDFGVSVDTGIKKLHETIQECKDSYYVLGGYSQGAMLLTKILPSLDAKKIIYVATFGDPKIYLPEGKGLIPAACLGRNLSDYRAYVPDCHAFEGILGGYHPYEPANFAGKLGTWCNKADALCSSYLNINDHTHYVEDGLYKDAARVIGEKIQTFNYASRDISVYIHGDLSINKLPSMLEELDRHQNNGDRVRFIYIPNWAKKDDASILCDFGACTHESLQALFGISSDSNKLDRAMILRSATNDSADDVLPVVESIGDVEWVSEDAAKINFKTTGTRVAVFLNDVLLGTTNENSITIDNLDIDKENIVTLAPLSKTRRGESIQVSLKNIPSSFENILKAPNAGIKLVF